MLQVPLTGPYMLHKGEEVRPAAQAGQAPVTLKIDSVNFYGVQNGDEAAEQFVRRLETDGTLRRRIERLKIGGQK